MSPQPIIYLLTNEKEINVLVSSQVDRAQGEDIVAQATNEPDGPHCARACGHPPRAKQIQDRMFLFHPWGLCLCDLQQRFAVLRCLRIQEFLHLQSVVEAVEAGHGVQKSLRLLVTPRGDQVEGRLGKHPADQQEWGGAEGEDDLVDPPNPHQITGESHHHDADCKEGMDVHGGPRAHLDAGELRHIDKHHHQVAAGYLQKKDRKGKESNRTRGGSGQWLKLNSTQFNKNYKNSSRRVGAWVPDKALCSMQTGEKINVYICSLAYRLTMWHTIPQLLLNSQSAEWYGLRIAEKQQLDQRSEG